MHKCTDLCSWTCDRCAKVICSDNAQYWENKIQMIEEGSDAISWCRSCVVEDDQENCPHDEHDHGICLDCEKDLTDSLAGRAEAFYEGDR